MEKVSSNSTYTHPLLTRLQNTLGLPPFRDYPLLYTICVAIILYATAQAAASLFGRVSPGDPSQDNKPQEPTDRTDRKVALTILPELPSPVKSEVATQPKDPLVHEREQIEAFQALLSNAETTNEALQEQFQKLSKELQEACLDYTGTIDRLFILKESERVDIGETFIETYLHRLEKRISEKKRAEMQMPSPGDILNSARVSPLSPSFSSSQL